MVNRGVGDVIRCDNVLDDCSTGPTELVAVVLFYLCEVVFMCFSQTDDVICCYVYGAQTWLPMVANLRWEISTLHRRFTLMRSLEKSTFNSNWGALPALVCCSHPKHRRLI